MNDLKSKDAAKPGLRLVGTNDGRPFAAVVAGEQTVLGSGDGVDLLIDDPRVSRRHALIEYRDRRWRVQDLKSKNGTWVNGGRLLGEEGLELVNGDVLTLGPVRLQVEATNPEDAELGVSTEKTLERPRGIVDRTTSGDGFGAQNGSSRWLQLIEEIVSAEPETSIGARLELVLGDLDADALALISWDQNGVAVIHGAAGDVDLIDSDGLEPQDDDGSTWRGFGADRLWVGRRRGNSSAVIVCHGLEGKLSATLRLLGLVLRLLAPAVAPPPVPVARDQPLPEIGKVPAEIVQGSSAAMRSVYAQIRQLVRGNIPVLLIGETGVGKDYLAQLIHAWSSRSSAPFHVVHCAAIPADLLESELFGIAKGVATGVEGRMGVLERTDGGTLLLDEIGELPLALQAKLLRVVENGAVQPVGAPAPVPVDLRLVAATNRDLLAEVEAGRFRADLYYRLAGYVLPVPPLRSRRSDIPGLVEHFVRRVSADVGKWIPGVTTLALQQLCGAAWPGNVRQLAHEVRRAVYLCADGAAIDSTLLSDGMHKPIGVEAGELDDLELPPAVAKLERRYLVEALRRAGGNKAEAARLLGLTWNGLDGKLKRIGIDPNDCL